MGRGRQLQRNLRLLQLLDRLQGVTIAEAAGELGCSLRTVYRDLHDLQAAGYPLHVDRDGPDVPWKFVEGFRLRHQIPFTHGELCALWMAGDALAGLEGTAFADSARAALEKIRSTLSTEVRARLDLARSAAAVLPPGRDYRARGSVTETLRRAAEERLTAEVLYEPLSGKRGRRLLDPYLLWFDPSSSALYLAAWAHDRREVRSFLVDRVRQAFLTERHFQPIESWDPKSWLAESFNAFRGKPVDVKLLFSGRAAKLVGERQWHASQQTRPRPGRQLELSLRVPLSPALNGWVMSWLPEVRRIEPKALRRAVLGALEMGLARLGSAMSPDDMGSVQDGDDRREA